MIASDYVVLDALVLGIIVFVQFPQKVLELATFWLAVDSLLVIAALLQCVVLIMRF